MKIYKTVDEYICLFPSSTQEILQKIRNIVREVAPNATEDIKYGIPTFVLNGNLVHFAAFKKHIGFYPTPSGIEKFIKDLEKYRSGKGTIQFPINKPIPYELIREIVEYRVKENLLKVRK